MWQMYLALTILVGQIIQPILSKKMADRGSLPRSLFWLYGFAAAFAILISIVLRMPIQNLTWIVACLGILNAFANYAYWQAIATPAGLSKTSIFVPMQNFVALGLGYVFLNELGVLTPWLGFGVLLLLASAVLFSWDRAGQAKKEGSIGSSHSIWKWITFFIVVWGVINFAMRPLAINELPWSDFILGFYGGSFVGAAAVYKISSKGKRGGSLTGKQIVNTAILATIIMSSVAFAYLTQGLAPITVVQPILGFSGILFPVAIGLLYFKEKKHLDKKGWVALLLGIVGATIIVFGY